MHHAGFLEGFVAGCRAAQAVHSDGEKDLDCFRVPGHDLADQRFAVDILFNPKYTARTNRMAKQKLYDEKYIKCFDNALYHLEEFSNNAEKEKVLKQRKLDIEDWLKDKTPEEKIDCIQEVRYALLMEDNAYRTEKKYTDIMRRNNLKTSDYDKEIDKYLFKEKAELLKQMGFETIKKEREKLIK